MEKDIRNFDVIVIGGGHAGIEAAHAAAKMGSNTALFSLSIDKIGLMPCNPAVGGIGKGHLVYEISALGGLMPKLCSSTYLQARMLNTSKGPAVQGLRLQIDKYAYAKLSQETLLALKNLTVFAGVVDRVLLDDEKKVCGVITESGETYKAPTVVITTGTFLNGRIHIGEANFSAGRRDEQAVTGLSKFFKESGLKLGRLKTGTPPRIARDSIDFSQLERQGHDTLNYLFEFYPKNVVTTHDCFMTYTNEKTHEVIRKNLHRSAMYNGNITGVGPRYCPSIEDKIGRFKDKTSHLIFIEPEGATADEIYPNGISTSLPAEVQLEYVRTIKGFENAVITKNGYAVEYDYVLPNQLKESLEVQLIPGLFLAGQINGTTGYEEAASQGIIAGINAHRTAHALSPFILDRNESYIGVMINDLITMGIDEPYRMFTSRAERRLVLRQDNVFLRLTDKARALGMIEDSLYADFVQEKEMTLTVLAQLRALYKPTDLLHRFGQEPCTVEQIHAATGVTVSERAALIIHAEIRYAPYLQREQKEIVRTQQYQKLRLPNDFEFTNLPGLSKELQEKLNKFRPASIADAALIPGMTPAAISLLIFKAREAYN